MTMATVPINKASNDDNLGSGPGIIDDNPLRNNLFTSKTPLA